MRRWRVRMRLCIDLDGVIADFKKENETYADVKPIPGAVEKLKELKQNGHYIIINTGRHMKTCEGNQGKVLARVGQITLDWLSKNEVPYDEIYFGKPIADVYIDDNGYRFSTWDEISGDGSNLPMSSEKRIDK